MKIFQKRMKPIENLTFVAITTAITVAFFAMLNFIPFSFLAIMMIFPLIAFVVSHVCQKRYFPIYFFATILLSITFAFYDLSNLLFYLIPSLVTGLIIEVLSERKLSIYYQIIVAAIFQLIATIISVPIIEVIYEINIFTDTVKLLGLENYPSIDSFIIPTVFLLSIIQVVTSYLFLIFAAPKLQIEIIYKDSSKIFYGGFAAIFGFLCFICAFIPVVKWMNFTLFILSIYFLVMMLITLNYKSKLNIFMLSISFIISFVLYVLLYKFIASPNQICVFSIIPVCFGVYYSIREGIYTK